MTMNDEASLSRILNRRTVRSGDIIFHEGDKGTQAYVVQRGRVRILKNIDGGEKGTLGFVEAGGIFGEMALMDDSPRMATAVAEEASVLIAIPEETVKKKLAKTHPVTKMMLMMMIRMLRTMSGTVSLKPVQVDMIPNMETMMNDE